jgi:predicted RNA-binding Zn-ribbon protein involved in translation (DUF1610 family)
VLTVSVYRFPLFFVRWQPPIQSRDDQVAFGREIEARGSLHYIGRFFSQREPFFAGIRVGWIALAVAVLTLICVFVPPLAPVFLGVLFINLVVYWGSFFVALARYSAWLSRCRRSYAPHKPREVQAEVIPSHVVVSCSSCLQQLRIPTDRGQVRAKCPSCGNIFMFDRSEHHQRT